MSTAIVTDRQDLRPLWADDLFDFWSRRTDEFMEWQRRNLIARQAAREELEEHGKRLDLILGLTLHMYSVASRVMPGALRTVRGRLRQLEDSRSLVDNPMTHPEADAILRQVFPDEPRTPDIAVKQNVRFSVAHGLTRAAEWSNASAMPSLERVYWSC